MSWLGFRLPVPCVILLTATLLCAVSTNTTFAQEVAARVDFNQQIVPLFKAKCYRCHDAMMQSGGLRLDRHEDVLMGGYSQKPLIGGTLDTNEIYLRVASKNAAYRMPKGDSPLDDHELALIKRWVEQGAIWPSPVKKVAEVEQTDWFDGQAWLDYLERWLQEVPGFIPWLITMLGLMLCLLFVERYKQAVIQNKPWTTAAAFRWLKPFRDFGLPHFLLAVTSMGWILSLLISKGQATKFKEVNSLLTQSLNQRSALAVDTKSVYGDPPIPQHPGHQPRLRGEYYRGNCERNPKLFNGGNYRTATLRINLIDANGQEVNYGDRVTISDLAIRFELDRALGTTPELYKDGTVLNGVFITPQLLNDTPKTLAPAPIRMSEVKPAWQWTATIPLASFSTATSATNSNGTGTQNLSGLLYIYQGTIDKTKGRGTLHYGLKYDLNFKDSVLQSNSEIWLGSLFWTPTLEHPTLGKVPLKQWFDHQPIPEVTGPNTTDPNLLGIPQQIDTTQSKQ